MNKFIEWKKLPRSIRFENAEVACDVWAIWEGRRIYKYTVYDKINKTYIGNGDEISEDDACEKALLAGSHNASRTVR